MWWAADVLVSHFVNVAHFENKLWGSTSAYWQRGCRTDSPIVQFVWPLCTMAAGLVEHAAWTKGDAYLDQPIKDMPWYQQLLLDSFVLLSTIAAVLVVFLMLVFKTCSKHMQRHAKMVWWQRPSSSSLVILSEVLKRVDQIASTFTKYTVFFWYILWTIAILFFDWLLGMG